MILFISISNIGETSFPCRLSTLSFSFVHSVLVEMVLKIMNTIDPITFHEQINYLFARRALSLAFFFLHLKKWRKKTSLGCKRLSFLALWLASSTCSCTHARRDQKWSLHPYLSRQNFYSGTYDWGLWTVSDKVHVFSSDGVCTRSMKAEEGFSFARQTHATARSSPETYWTVDLTVQLYFHSSHSSYSSLECRVTGLLCIHCRLDFASAIAIASPHEITYINGSQLLEKSFDPYLVTWILRHPPFPSFSQESHEQTPSEEAREQYPSQKDQHNHQTNQLSTKPDQTRLLYG